MNSKTMIKGLPFFAIALIPFLLVLHCIRRFGVEMPSWDDWELITYLEKWHDGSLTIADLFDQHTESRILIPRILMMRLVRISGWYACYIANLLTAFLTFLVLAYKCIRTTSACCKHRHFWLVVPLSMLSFSALQHECWTFGFALVCYTNLFFVAAGFSLPAAAPFSWMRFAGSLTAGAMATYSYANGMLYWLAGLPMLYVASRPKQRAPYVIWTIFAAAMIVPYFIGYSRPVVGVPLLHSIRHPVQLALFFFAFIGGAVVNIPHLPASLAVVAGAIGVLVFAGGTLMCFRAGGKVLRYTALWISLGAYALLSALAAASGRSLYGFHRALAGRYTIFSGLFWIATIVISTVLIDRAGSRGLVSKLPVFRPRTGILVFAAFCFFGFAASSRHAVTAWRRHHRLQRAVRNEFLLCLPDAAMLAHGYPHKIRASWLDFMTRHNISAFREKRKFADYLETDIECGRVESATGDLIPDKIFPGGSFQISGYAHDPKSGRPARAVLLVDDKRRIIARADVDSGRASEWTVSLPGSKLPAGVSPIDVYALLQDGASISRIGTLALEKLPLSKMQSEFPIAFVERHDIEAGYMDNLKRERNRIFCDGWAGNPVTGKAGPFVIVTDRATNILAFCKVGDERRDVASRFLKSGLLYSGWVASFDEDAPGPGRHVIRAYLLLPEKSRALRLHNEFEVVTGESLTDRASDR